MSYRVSFLILNLTPWSPNDRERNVDSDIPGKFFAEYTGKDQSWKSLMGLFQLTGKCIGDDGLKRNYFAPTRSLAQVHETDKRLLSLKHFEKSESQPILALVLDRDVAENKKAAICYSPRQRLFPGLGLWFYRTCIVSVFQSMERRNDGPAESAFIIFVFGGSILCCMPEVARHEIVRTLQEISTRISRRRTSTRRLLTAPGRRDP